MYVVLSRSQAGSGKAVKQEQEERSRNHIQTSFLGSVVGKYFPCPLFWFILSQISFSSISTRRVVLGPEIILVRGCENVAGKLRQKW